MLWGLQSAVDIVTFWTHANHPISSFLCVASAVSFIPQLFRIVARQNSSGLAIAYALLNHISATHQLALGALYIGFADVEDNVFVWSWPPSTTDWLNLAQLIIFWAGTFVMYARALFKEGFTFARRSRITLTVCCLSQLHCLLSHLDTFSGSKVCSCVSLPGCPPGYSYISRGDYQQPWRTQEIARQWVTISCS